MNSHCFLFHLPGGIIVQVMVVPTSSSITLCYHLYFIENEYVNILGICQ